VAGSWTFLGAILTSIAIEPDTSENDHCGSCRKCLDVCPTDAFPAPYQLDARRCISYLTIEHKGHIPRALRSLMGNRVFGCDDCLAVCPWNKFARASAEMKREASAPLPAIADILALDDHAFRRRYAGTVLKRTGRHRVVRNALIAAGNSGEERLLPEVEKLLRDDSPLVRAAAAWALGQISKPRAAMLADRFLPLEPDAEVQAEWRAVGMETAPT
jgi:epoxyqueuosine reductase